MPRGGRREGAGRKKGSVSVLTRKTAEIAAAQGITPLEVTLITMRALWAQANGETVTLDTDKAKEAMVVADRAAPYCHARIAPTEPKPQSPDDQQTTESSREISRRAAFVVARELALRGSESKQQPKPAKKKLALIA